MTIATHAQDEYIVNGKLVYVYPQWSTKDTQEERYYIANGEVQEESVSVEQRRLVDLTILKVYDEDDSTSWLTDDEVEYLTKHIIGEE